MTNVTSVRLPYYFYDINAVMPNGQTRWVDEFVDEAPSIIQAKDLALSYVRQKNARNMAYAKWQASFFWKDAAGECHPFFKAKKMQWQAIRVYSFKHSESSKKDWWENYQDACFRVFVEPETVYDQVTGEHKQWYLLSPEDGYLVNKLEMEKAGVALSPREPVRERWLSSDKRLRQARFIPVECCKHYRHETTGGVLPEGL